MKLRNKKTGEIIDIYKGSITLNYDQGRKTIHFKCLEDLEDWEDYEEPKEKWLITEGGNVIGYPSEAKNEGEKIGNDFKTKEEAEKAVEKLKAWKRLKDKGFRFTDFCKFNDFAFTIRAISDERWNEMFDDLDLLFGGKE